MRHALQGIANPMLRSRALWFGVAWVAAALLTILGAAFVVTGGQHITGSGRGYVVIRDFMPGGMRAHGAIMLVLGGLLSLGLAAPLYGLDESRRYLRRVLKAVGAYQFWIAWAFATAPLAGGVFGLSIFLWWSASVIITALLVMLPPPTQSETAGWTRGVGRA